MFERSSNYDNDLQTRTTYQYKYIPSLNYTKQKEEKRKEQKEKREGSARNNANPNQKKKQRKKYICTNRKSRKIIAVYWMELVQLVVVVNQKEKEIFKKCCETVRNQNMKKNGNQDKRLRGSEKRKEKGERQR